MDTKETQVVDEIKNSKEVGWVKTLFSKIKGKVLIYVLLGIGVFIGAYYLISGISPSIIKQTERANAQLEKSIDTLKQNNLALESKVAEQEKTIQGFVDIVNKNNSLIQQNNAQLNSLKKLYNEKINSITNYSTSQLDSFFTNRYQTK